MKRMVIGDIHGRFEALKEVLKLSKFDYKKDKLIVLGDIADGGYNTAQVVEELLKIKKLVYIIGNHDEWFLNHIKTGWAEQIWLSQGGANTIKSYGGIILKEQTMHEKVYVVTKDVNIPVTHQDFFNKGIYYYKYRRMLFVHGGYDLTKGVEKTDKETLLWDRELIPFAKYNKIPFFKKVFIGHTTTLTQGSNLDVKDSMAPIWYNNLCMMDTGAGWKGKLSIMDIDTEKYWCSKRVI